MGKLRLEGGFDMPESHGVIVQENKDFQLPLWPQKEGGLLAQDQTTGYAFSFLTFYVLLIR